MSQKDTTDKLAAPPVFRSGSEPALVEETPVSGVMDLTAQDVSDLIGMGPSAFHQTEDAAEALEELFRNERSGRVEVTKSFVLQVFRNTPREEGAEGGPEGRL